MKHRKDMMPSQCIHASSTDRSRYEIVHAMNCELIFRASREKKEEGQCSN
jgi:hypothetical protein